LPIWCFQCVNSGWLFAACVEILQAESALGMTELRKGETIYAFSTQEAITRRWISLVPS
jgi:hypothetical protein